MARRASVGNRQKGKLAGLKAMAVAVAAASTPGGPSPAQRLSALPRLARSVAEGKYHGAGAGQLAMLTAAAAYVASPVDLLPEALLGVVGLADDAVVITWFAGTLVRLTDDFLDWERRTGVTVTSERVR